MNVQPNTEPTGNRQRTERDLAEEERLLAATANGDRGAFDRFCELYRGFIFSVVHRVINNVQDSQDTTQEVIWQIWRKAGSFERAKGTPRSWVLTMSRNRAIDRVRANGRRSRLRESAANEAEVVQQIRTADPRSSAVASERRKIVRSAILELNEKQQEVLHLAYFAELTQAEIAKRLGEPLGTVKARIRRSVRRLQSSVGQQLEA